MKRSCHKRWNAKSQHMWNIVSYVFNIFFYICPLTHYLQQNTKMLSSLHPFSLPHSVIKITACLCTVLIPTSLSPRDRSVLKMQIQNATWLLMDLLHHVFFSLSHTDHSIQYYKYRHHSMLLSIMWWRKGGEGVIGPLTLRQSVTTFTTSKAIFWKTDMSHWTHKTQKEKWEKEERREVKVEQE